MGNRGLPSTTQGPVGQGRGFVQNATGGFSAHPSQDIPAFDQRPSDLRINTGPKSNLPLGPTPTSAAAMRTQSPSAYTHSFPSTRAPNSAGTGMPATTRAIDLHKRSRSPRLGRRGSSEDLTQRNTNDPAAGLGTFSSKSRSPNTADREDAAQEKPWAISLPTDAEENAKYTRTLQRSESAGNRGGAVELPGSKAPGDESDEDLNLSANAIPGSWDAMDLGYGHWDE